MTVSADPSSRAEPTPPSTSRPSRLRQWRWLIVIAYMAVLFFVSAQSTLPELPGKPSDKQEHFVAYGVLGALVVWALSCGQVRQVTWRTVVTAVVVASAYGYSDEFHQRFVPNRSYDLYDWAADTAGAALAAVLAWAWGILLRGRTRIHGV